MSRTEYVARAQKYIRIVPIERDNNFNLLSLITSQPQFLPNQPTLNKNQLFPSLTFPRLSKSSKYKVKLKHMVSLHD